MDNYTRFKLYINALQQYSGRVGNCNVPSTHIEKYEDNDVALGAWVGYVRQRYKKSQLSDEKARRLESISGWNWGPLKPGPATDNERNRQIHEMRAAGSSLRQIADKFDLSRQRVHQIVKNIA